VVGHYASTNDEAAASLLDDAIRLLRDNGCTLAIGPMDGNTWRRYRFVVDPGPEPPFFLEPVNPAEWPLQFERAGFRPLANYFSALNSDLSQMDDRMPRVAERMAQLDVVVRPAQQDELRQELARIYRLSEIAFTRNFLYTELSEAAFFAQYEKVIPHIRPELLLLAERGRELVGFLFAIPDLAQAARGAKMDTFLIKTFAVPPDPKLAGLGGLLAARVQEEGRRMGFGRCIHALMFENNVSRNVSRHYAAATTMRKYVLFSRDLH
jgi:GNAT superfamily N-acetyltransferase